MIRLIREVRTPGNSGPSNGQYALQRALLAKELPWLKIGGELQPGEIPWIWSYEDKPLAVRCEVERRPFILGPNVLFLYSRRPGAGHAESFLLNAAHCRLLITESRWYEQLIESCRGKRNTAPIVFWPYPIDPLPEGPRPATFDLLIFRKSGVDDALIHQLQNAYPSNVEIRYGRFSRRRLLDCARQSRVCVYLSDDDRGPLALAEILLCGCPCVGIERGAPWINGCNGTRVESLGLVPLIEGVTASGSAIDRGAVREMALATFSPAAVVERVVAAFYSLI